MLCHNCHWLKDDPFQPMSDGKVLPCSNIGVDGWDFWVETQIEPEHCEGYCARGEYVPTGVWAGMAKVVKAVAEIIADEKEERNE